MKLGTSFPITALSDLGAVRDFAQALDGAGFDFVATSGHVLGAPDGSYEGRPSATYVGPFYDPFVLFAYLAGVTQHLGFLTSILILPAYPTALVAKQAAELDFVSGGRFQLGVGLSWQEAEYAALGQDLHNRGRRLAEQVQVLRMFWAKPFVDFEGTYHRLEGVGLNRQPISIPIWIGCGNEERPLRRVARLADGWLPLGDPEPSLPALRQYLVEYGRDPATFGLTGRVTASDAGADDWLAQARRLQTLGATQLTLGAPGTLAPAAALARLIEARDVLAAALT